MALARRYALSDKIEYDTLMGIVRRCAERKKIGQGNVCGGAGGGGGGRGWYPINAKKLLDVCFALRNLSFCNMPYV